MKVPMDPVEVDGVLRPDLDQRWVPRATMARYLNVSGDTVRLWTLRGQFPATAVRKFGADTRYYPALCMPAAATP